MYLKKYILFSWKCEVCGTPNTKHQIPNTISSLVLIINEMNIIKLWEVKIMINLNEINIENRGNGTDNLKRIIKGSVFSILLTIVLLFIFSILLTYTNINENITPIVLITITALSILIGSIMSSLHISKNGIVNGALVGIIYIAFIYLLSSIIIGNFSLNTYSLIMIIASILAGAIGGIIGINQKSKKS